MKIDLHIERLILDGLPLNQREGAVLQNALERELAQLLGRGGIERLTGGALPNLPVGAIQLSSAGQPAQWGRQIARALHGGLAAHAPARRTPDTLRGDFNSPPVSRPSAVH
jgi:hypothetical protein